MTNPADPFRNIPNAGGEDDARLDAVFGPLPPPVPAVPPVSMGIVSARGFIKGHDDDVKAWSRMSRAGLIALIKNGRQWVPGYGPEGWSKDELISALAESRWPLADLHQAIHVVYHVDGLTNSACQWCPVTVPGLAEHTAAACDTIAKASQ